jgi:hypothetical protein
VAQRAKNRQARLVKAARFPVLKELADFDFTCVPSVSKQQVLDLAQGGYIRKAEPILMVGNPGLGVRGRSKRWWKAEINEGVCASRWCGVETAGINGGDVGSPK